MRHVAIEPRPWRAPAEVLSAFGTETGTCAFLSGGEGPRARWSYVLRAPDAFAGRRAGLPPAMAPFEDLRGLIGERFDNHPDGPPFQGGVAGLASYELADWIEPVDLHRNEYWPDLAAYRYPQLLAFDHREQRVLAVGRGADPAEAQGRAGFAASWLEAPRRPAREGALAREFRVRTPAEAYEASVAQVVRRIRAGEIFQANIARIWTGALADGAEPIDLLLRLAADSPAPFAGWLHMGGYALVSNSPERFVTLDAGRDFRMETRPIKGTRPRGATPQEDRALADDLLASDKDRAENLMIVDLMRNDLARVSPPGSVRTPELFAVESFANVHHLVSTVTATLAPGLTAVDLLQAAFPPGSVTGAPKVQAMKVIKELEPARGPYCGSLFWAGVDGSFDSSVLIRTAAFVGMTGAWMFEARAGAGIVADSDPRAERLETEAKIAALKRALT
ncbi:MAG: aminodeoxychorismate synthase component [Caulobacter sp.]|jgi:para-aminobenzoate synthetase component 1|nr:aminodeoxychorismate synthase component [Caulobacter sp.]